MNATKVAQEINAIYLDTQPLRGAAWPIPRAALVTLLSLAHQIGIPVYMPEPVAAELEAQFRRRYVAAQDKVTQAWGAIEGVYKSAAATPPIGAPTLPSIDEAVASYRTAVTVALDTHRIVMAPRSKRSVDEYFDMNLEQTAPFDKDGRGFKDALILMTVVDHLRASPRLIGMLVTSDNDFKGVDALSQNEGTQLIVRNVDAAVTLLEGRLKQAEREAYAKAEEQALEFGRKHIDQINQFVSGVVGISSTDVAAPHEQLRVVRAIEVKKIRRVQSVPPFNEAEDGQEVKLTYALAVTITAEVTRIAATLNEPFMLRVGETPPQAEPDNPRDQLVRLLVERELEARRDVRDVDKAVELDVAAARVAGGYDKFTPVAATLAPFTLGDFLDSIRAPSDKA